MPKLHFTYILPSTCFPKTSTENVNKGVVLQLRRICDSDDQFEEHSVQYQKYLVARDYKPSKVKKQFSDVRNISREEARRPKNNNNFSASCNLHNIIHYSLTSKPLKNIYLCYTAATKCFKSFQKTLLMLHIDEVKA